VATVFYSGSIINVFAFWSGRSRKSPVCGQVITPSKMLWSRPSMQLLLSCSVYSLLIVSSEWLLSL